MAVSGHHALGRRGGQRGRGPLPEDQKERVLGQIGETIAQVQRVPVGDLARIEPHWPRSWRSKSRDAAHGMSASGLPPKFLDGLDELLVDAEALIRWTRRR